MNKDVVKTVLESAIFDLEIISKITQERNTAENIKSVIRDLKKLQKHEEDIVNINFVKRIIYNRMMALRDEYPNRSRELYFTYQKLKRGQIDPANALEQLF